MEQNPNGANERRIMQELLAEYERNQRSERIIRRIFSIMRERDTGMTLSGEERHFEDEGGASVTEVNDRAFFADCGCAIRAKEDIGRVCISCGKLMCARCAEKAYGCFNCGRPLCILCSRANISHERFCGKCSIITRVKRTISILFGR